MKNSFRFKKKYGQNFLMDKNVLNKIECLVDNFVDDDYLALEIGTGSGVLTKVLCQKCKFVLGYEIDLEVKELLFDNLCNYSNYEIIFEDFMKSSVLDNLSNYDYEHLAVIANIPYYITTPIIEKIINLGINPEFMLFMVQKEVACRFCAKVGDRDYNSFTIFLNYYYEVKKEFIVSRNSFYPVPNVDSAIVSFRRRKEVVSVKNLDFFNKLVRDSFRFNRKTIKNNLYDYDLEGIFCVLKKHGLDLNVRPNEISLEVYCDIANYICS